MRLRPSRQAIVLVVALGLWSLFAEPSFWAIVAAYGAAWLLVNGIAVVRPRWLEVDASRPTLVLLGVVLAAPPAVALWRARTDILENEGLLGLEANAADRLRLERSPSIAPGVVFTHEPQTFYVRADGARRVEVKLGAARSLEAVSLGHGLFRASYDPRRDGAARRLDGEVDATITVDGSPASRTLHGVAPLAHPRWPCLSPDRRMAAVPSEETDELAVVDATGLLARLDVGDGPLDCAFVGGDRIAVAHRFDDVEIVDLRGRVRARADLGAEAGRLALSPSATALAVARGGRSPGVSILSLPSLEVVATVALDARPDWLAFGAGDETLIAALRRPASLVRLSHDAGGWSSSGELLLGRPAVTMARTPTGERVIVAVTDFRADGEPHRGNHFIQDQLLDVDVASLRVVGQRLTQRRSPRQGRPGDVDRGASPMGIDVAGGDTYVAFAGTDELFWISPGRPAPTPIDLAPLGLIAPHGVARLEGGALVVTSPAAGAIGVLARGGDPLAVVRLAPDDETLLRERPEALKRRMGEHGFYEATRSGVSCQSCHLHAGSDQAMHNVGEGRLSPTLTVRGVAGTAPYLRDGSYPRVRDLDELSQTLYRGFLRRAPSRGLTLEAFVYGLPRTPPLAREGERDLERERAGVDAFVKARCDTCHAFPALTNLGQHPAGAIFPSVTDAPDLMLDTPSLLVTTRTPPFLADGRAESLASVVRDHDEDGRHGELARLSSAEKEDLVYFLESL